MASERHYPIRDAFADVLPQCLPCRADSEIEAQTSER
jgi:hypothetical protein